MRILKEPLVWFSALGGAIFALNHNSPVAPVAPQEIHLSEAHVQALRLREAQRRGRELSAEDVRETVARFVDEEVLARHGTALGLSEGDPIIRRRIAQMVQLVAEADVDEPTDDDLLPYLKKNATRYAVEESWELQLRAYGPGEEGQKAAAGALRDGDLDRGELPLPSGRHATWRSAAEVDDSFGPAVVARLRAGGCDAWCGPAPSLYGYVLLRTSAHRPAATPSYAELRPRLRQSFLNAARHAARAARLGELREQYDVKVDWPEDLEAATVVAVEP